MTMTQSKQLLLEDSTQISNGISEDKESIDEQEFEESIWYTRCGITIEHPKSYGFIQQILTQFMNLNIQDLDQGTQEKVTNAIAQKDSHESFKQLRDMTEELGTIKHVHFGKNHITVYKGLYLSKGYKHIFATLVDQLDQLS